MAHNWTRKNGRWKSILCASIQLAASLRIGDYTCTRVSHWCISNSGPSTGQVCETAAREFRPATLIALAGRFCKPRAREKTGWPVGGSKSFPPRPRNRARNRKVRRGGFLKCFFGQWVRAFWPVLCSLPLGFLLRVFPGLRRGASPGRAPGSPDGRKAKRRAGRQDRRTAARQSAGPGARIAGRPQGASPGRAPGPQNSPYHRKSRAALPPPPTPWLRTLHLCRLWRVISGEIG